MIAVGVNAFSTHLVVMAADELLEHIVHEAGTRLTLDLEAQLTPHGIEIMRAHKRDAYNFLKHGKRGYRIGKPAPDAEQIEALNDVMTIVNIHAYRDVTNEYPAYMAAMVAGVALMNEGMVDWDRAPAEAARLRREIGDFSRSDFREFLLKSL